MNTGERIANMTFSSIYPYYKEKIEKKWRTEEELIKVISWLTGYNEEEIIILTKKEITFQDFFKNANLNPNATLIKWSICWHKIEEIENKLTQKVRYLDKIVDELAKWKELSKIFRTK